MSGPARRAPFALVHSLALVLLCGTIVFGQSFTASVRGTAKDVSGGVIRLAQNVLNKPIFGDPNTSFGSTAFGQITSTKVGPRQMMLGFKYYF